MTRSGDSSALWLFRTLCTLPRRKILDLVEVAPNANPPVCRMMDYGKYLYEKQKRERNRAGPRSRLRSRKCACGPKRGEHDIQVVLTKTRKFLKDGAKVRVRIRFRGREIVHRDIALDLMKRVTEELVRTGGDRIPPRF